MGEVCRFPKIKKTIEGPLGKETQKKMHFSMSSKLLLPLFANLETQTQGEETARPQKRGRRTNEKYGSGRSKVDVVTALGLALAVTKEVIESMILHFLFLLLCRQRKRKWNHNQGRFYRPNKGRRRQRPFYTHTQIARQLRRYLQLRRPYFRVFLFHPITTIVFFHLLFP